VLLFGYAPSQVADKHSAVDFRFAAQEDVDHERMSAQERRRIRGGHQPERWSREEAFLRTGVYVGGQRDWQPTENGGSDVVRALNLYGADRVNQHPYAETPCRKRQDYQKPQLVPGIYLLHCAGCGLCVGFQLMITAESPAVPFELLYTRFESLPSVFVADNACHVVR